jgi:hypothetical protein
MDEEELRAKLSIYSKIIERYADAINEGEQKTVPKLKSLINPENKAISDLARKLEAEVSQESGRSFEFSEDWSALLKKAIDFVFSIKQVDTDLTVSFWLSPEEILEIGASDSFDKCVFLASLLEALGFKPRVRVIELKNGVRQPIVLVEENEEEFLIAPAQGILSSGKNALSSYSSGDSPYSRSLYEFSKEGYEEFE